MVLLVLLLGGLSLLINEGVVNVWRNDLMKMLVNGSEREFDEGTTLSEMIKSLELDITGMIVERNLTVVSRSEYDSTVLNDGDTIELIRLVAGG